jgi:hypothetical protein
MRKGFLIVLAVALVAALAAPAVAGTDINGLYRAKAWVSNFRTTGTTPAVDNIGASNAFVEQRMRLRFSSGEENVKAVAQFEIDFTAWGDVAGGNPVDVKNGATVAAAYTGGAARNGGGALGADRINLETKNVYLWFKLPNTSLDFTVGLQGQSDAYAGLLFGAADMAGVFVKGKFEPVDYSLGWAKLYENASAKADDLTLYAASAKFAPTKDVKVGLNLYFLQDDTGKIANTLPATGSTMLTAAPLGFGNGALGYDLYLLGANKKKIYIPGVDFALNAGPAALTGFFIYETGKVDYQAAATKDIDVKGFAFDLRGDMNVGPGKAFLEGLYISGGDNVAKEIKSIVTLSDFDASPGGNSAFARTDMSILLVNGDDINCAQALVGARAVPSGTSWGASTSPALGGRGLTHIAAGYTQKLNDKVTGKFGAGYLRANKLLLVTDSWKKGKVLGTEVNANVNYNIMKGLDFGVYGAYAWLGNYFQDKDFPNEDPKNPWSANLRLNYAF